MGSSRNFIQLIKNKTKKYLTKEVKGFIKDQLKVFRSKELNNKDSGKKFTNHIDIDGIVFKRLTTVEADKKKSNQHEFNGSNLLKELLGKNEPKEYQVTFAWIESRDNLVTEEGFVTWYDSRRSHPSRSEYRLYFKENIISRKFIVNDPLFIIKRSDSSLLLISTKANSDVERQLLFLFSLKNTNFEINKKSRDIFQKGEIFDLEFKSRAVDEYILDFFINSSIEEEPVATEEEEPIDLEDEIEEEPIATEEEEPIDLEDEIEEATKEEKTKFNKKIKSEKLNKEFYKFRNLNFKDQLKQLKNNLEFSEQRNTDSKSNDFIENVVEKSIDKKYEKKPIISTDSEFLSVKVEDNYIDIDLEEIKNDESQESFLKLIEDNNLICISPPGHGKTATAISAVEKYLEISETTRLQNIYFLTFTKAATREARKRLKNIDPYQSIRCFTIDSFAGQINQLVKNQTGQKFYCKNYEESIELATKFVSGICDPESSKLVKSFLNNQIDLLVIDEAQDINDIRNKFMKYIFCSIHKDARILIFGDPVQEIYTFQNKGIKGTLLNYAVNNTYRNFIRHELKFNHRVKNKKLLNSFKIARDIYKQKNISAKNKNLKLINYLKEFHNSSLEDKSESGSVFLFRRNIDVLNSVLLRLQSRKKSAFRISYLHEINEPFLAFIIKEFFPYEKVSLDKIWSFIEGFDINKLEKIYEIDQVGQLIDNIENYYGDGQENIEIKKIVDDFENSIVPDFFSTKTWGKGKNTFSSIHSYKGREAKNIVLNYASNSISSDEEEFRVYYVALTRAVEKLRFREFNSEKILYKKYYGKREYIPNLKAVAFGLSGDFVWSNESDHYELDMQQEWLAKNAKNIFEVEIIRNIKRNKEDSYDLITKKDGKYLGCLSFQMKEILKKEYDNQIPSRFKNVFMVGTTATLIEQYLPDEEFNNNFKIIMKKIQNKPKVIFKPNIIGLLQSRNG